MLPGANALLCLRFASPCLYFDDAVVVPLFEDAVAVPLLEDSLALPLLEDAVAVPLFEDAVAVLLLANRSQSLPWSSKNPTRALVYVLSFAHPEIAGMAAMQSHADPILSLVENMVDFLSLLFRTLLICDASSP